MKTAIAIFCLSAAMNAGAHAETFQITAYTTCRVASVFVVEATTLDQAKASIGTAPATPMARRVQIDECDQWTDFEEVRKQPTP